METKELIIFKNNEITPNLFILKNKYKYIEFGNTNELKNIEYGNFKDLDYTKSKLDTINSREEYIRLASVKYLHEYELVKVLCRKKVISRAYFKLYEMIYFESIIGSKKLDCFFICEAPGGFIECVFDIRRKNNYLKSSFISISIDNDTINYNRYIDKNKLLYGDITNLTVIDNTIKSVKNKYPQLLDFITADGGFDIKNFNNQEILTNKLLLSEIYLALNTQKVGGMFIIKFFDMLTHNSIIYYLILCLFYSRVKIIKPQTSRNSNSERYLMCYSFLGINSSNGVILKDIKLMIPKIRFDNSTIDIKGIHTLLYPDFNFNKIPSLSLKLKPFNNLIIYKQIQTINDSIQIIYSQNIDYQRTLIDIFNNSNNIIKYKNFLNTKIQKSMGWLRLYNILTI